MLACVLNVKFFSGQIFFNYPVHGNNLKQGRLSTKVRILLFLA